MYNPKPGDIGLSQSDGLFGKFILKAQALLGDWAIYTHAFIYIGDGLVVEAMPRGAQIDDSAKYDFAHTKTVYAQLDLTAVQRHDIVLQALKLVGTPYSFLDFLALGLTHYKIKPGWVRRRVQNSGHMICSQLVTEAYRRAGIELFPDKRLSQDVTPGDLAESLEWELRI